MGNLIWVASYPKSGNTWVRLVLHALTTGKPLDELHPSTVPAIARRDLLDRLIGFPTCHLSAQAQQEIRPTCHRRLDHDLRKRAYFKVHDGYGKTPAGEWLFPPEVTAAAIYIIRNPLDVAVSWAHYTGCNLDDSIAQLGNDTLALGMSKIAGPTVREPLGTWSAHVTSWENAPVPLHVLRYEDMLADPVKTFGGLCEFLGLSVTPDFLAEVIDSCRFERLKAIEDREGFRDSSQHAPFFRQGNMGEGGATLSSDQIARIVSDHGTVMRRFGYESALEV